MRSSTAFVTALRALTKDGPTVESAHVDSAVWPGSPKKRRRYAQGLLPTVKYNENHDDKGLFAPGTVVHEVKNEEDGVTARVAVATRGGYNVTLRDDDAGEVVGNGTNFPDLERAKAYAHTVAGVKTDVFKDFWSQQDCLDTVAEAVHDSWMEACYDPSDEHAIPFKDLPNDAQEVDRQAARAVLRTLEELGYTLSKAP